MSATWTALLVGIGATYVWRFAGVLLASRIDPNGAIFRWLVCVSYAVLAGLVARMILLPAGSLGEAPLTLRLAAVALGFACFAATRRVGLATVIGLLGFAVLLEARRLGFL